MMLPWPLIGVLALVSVALLCLLGYAAVLARGTTEVRRLPLHGHPTQYGLLYEDVTFPSRDRLTLRGWYIPSKEDTHCIVFIQGHGHHRNSPGIRALELGRDLVKHGFSVLLFDLRGRGESGGKRGSAGNQEFLDVLGAVDYVGSRGVPLERTGLLGFSLGAGLAIHAGVHEPRLPAFVCDSGFQDLFDDYQGLRLGPVPLPGWFMAPLVSLVGRVLFRSDPGKVRPIRVIDRLHPRPVLFVHGEQDDVVPAGDSVALFHRYPNPHNQLWLVPGAVHVGSYALNRREYVERVARFFRTHLR